MGGVCVCVVCVWKGAGGERGLHNLGPTFVRQAGPPPGTAETRAPALDPSPPTSPQAPQPRRHVSHHALRDGGKCILGSLAPSLHQAQQPARLQVRRTGRANRQVDRSAASRVGHSVPLLRRTRLSKVRHAGLPGPRADCLQLIAYSTTALFTSTLVRHTNTHTQPHLQLHKAHSVAGKVRVQHLGLHRVVQ